MDRREFLGAAALTGLSGSAAAADPPAAAAAFPGMIVREREPVNHEFPFSALDQFIVPAERFFKRNHFRFPQVDPATWRLRVEGAVEKPLELSLDDVRRLPAVSRPLTLECAGNGRVYLTPKVRGVGWQLGAVGNAEWTGVPLSEVLARAGLKPTVAEIVLEGADRGSINDDPKSPGPIAFARSLPLDKAKKPEVLLAHTMNGQPLPAEHGSPLRAVVGGWFGVASVKWLTRIIAVEKPFAGFWQTFDYTYHVREHGLPVIRPISELLVKASIARPAVGDVVAANSAQRVYGAAWSGESPVARVELSTDGGSSWHAVKLLEPEAPFAWRLWEYRWQTPARPGRATLMVRATDARGRTQPLERDPDRRTYMINHVIPVSVEVR